MIGSSKQIEWAKKIAQEKIQSIEGYKKFPTSEGAKTILENPENVEFIFQNFIHAAFWIENRFQPLHKIYENIRSNSEYYLKKYNIKPKQKTQ